VCKLELETSESPVADTLRRTVQRMDMSVDSLKTGRRMYVQHKVGKLLARLPNVDMTLIFGRASDLYLCLHNQLFALFHYISKFLTP
jgi:hypothetical protein